MWSPAHDQQLSLYPLFREAQELKRFYHEPAGNTGIDQEHVWQGRMSADARQPGKRPFQTEATQQRAANIPAGSLLCMPPMPITSGPGVVPP
jgi:hypothetical protein